MRMAGWEPLLRFVLDGVWPQSCPLCARVLDRREDTLANSIHTLFHRSCFERLPRAKPVPGIPQRGSDGVPVRAWLKDSPAFFELLHAAKYGGRPSLLLPLAAGLSDCASRNMWIPPNSCLLPVPDDPWRRSERGFSPVGILAREISNRFGCQLRHDLLRRRRAAAPLASIDDPQLRAEHQRELWGVGRLSEVPRERCLILVDDQVTTGSTVRSLVRLLAARGNPVLVLCLAAATRSPRQV
jgi:predicted amidophosphoribosyltransferase